jgi:hypothetical protein
MSSRKRGASRSRRKGPTPRNTTKTLGTTRTAPLNTRNGAVGKPGDARSPEPEASSRFTPKLKARGPFRPTWHKVIGALLILAGLGIFVLNDLAWFDINLIPGGHNELWAVAGIGTAFTSTWWFGWFDRTPKPSSR